ncbi:MAG TPA: YbjN domain-containing protein [Aestuariivirgaceae bacterium]|jgi:hypothetical protein
MTAVRAHPQELANPLDKIEDVAAAHKWTVDRPAEDEVHMIVEGSWSDLHLCLNWREDLEGLHLACTFDIKVPQGRREEVVRLTSLINEQLYFGHFDIWRTDGTLLFRNGLILAGGVEIVEAQCETLLRLALEACERYFPAFQFVIWAGKTAEQAIQSSLMETAGEA